MFEIKKIKYRNKCAFSDFTKEYYIVVNNQLLGNPLTLHQARLIKEWLNSINTKELFNKEKEASQDDNEQ